MLVAPLSVPSSTRPRAVVATSRPVAPARGAVMAWLIAGLVAIAVVPALRGGGTLGATLPFWLVAAPAIDLVWIDRRRLARRFTAWRIRAFARTGARNVRRQRRSLRSVACSAVKS